MFMNSKYEKERRQQFSMFAAEQRARDAGQIRHSKAVFDNKTNLITQIERDIFPALVGIETACGRVGMGFFQHERWLVSNAHVIKHRSEIEQGIVLKKSDGTDCLLDELAQRAYSAPTVSNLQLGDLPSVSWAEKIGVPEQPSCGIWPSKF